MSDRDEHGQAGFQEGELGGGLRPPGVGRGYGRDYGAGGRNQGFDGSWGQGYGGSLEIDDYREGAGGDVYGGLGEDQARSFGGRGQDAGGGAREGASGPHGGRGPSGWSRSDARLLEDVSEALMEDRLLDAREIEVRVEDGVVSLSGEVPGASDVRLAEQIVRRCRGVQDVRTDLQVRGQRRPDLAAGSDAPNPFHPPGQDHAVTSTERNAQLGDREES